MRSLKQMAEKFESNYALLLKNILPVPVELEYIRQSPTEVIVQWKNAVPCEQAKGRWTLSTSNYDYFN